MMTFRRTRKSGIKYVSRYGTEDAAALVQMKQLIGTGSSTSPHNAALQLAPRLKGASPEATVKRLTRKFTTAFPCWKSDRSNWT